MRHAHCAINVVYARSSVIFFAYFDISRIPYQYTKGSVYFEYQPGICQ